MTRSFLALAPQPVPSLESNPPTPASTPLSQTEPPIGTELATQSQELVEPPSAWMQYGTSPTEIILAIAVVIGSISSVIGSIALLVRTLVPVMPQSPMKSDKPN
jgi:hypothetical protein